MSIRAIITLTFDVADEDLLTRLSDEAIAADGGGVEIDTKSPWACRIVETLLHSNPDIAGYLDYGIELVDTRLVDIVAVTSEESM